MNMRLVIVVKSWFLSPGKKFLCSKSCSRGDGGTRSWVLVQYFPDLPDVDAWIGGGWCRGGLYFMHTTNLGN